MASWYLYRSVRSWADAFKMMSFGDGWRVIFRLRLEMAGHVMCFVLEVTPSQHLHENRHIMLLLWHCWPSSWERSKWMIQKVQKMWTMVQNLCKDQTSISLWRSLDSRLLVFLFWEIWETKQLNLNPVMIQLTQHSFYGSTIYMYTVYTLFIYIIYIYYICIYFLDRILYIMLKASVSSLFFCSW